MLLVVMSIVFFGVAWTVPTPPFISYLFPIIGLLFLVLAGSFQYLVVEDEGDKLAVRFGPLPLFATRIPYAEIESFEVGKTIWIEGWGIHFSVRGGWVWNLWGWDCVLIRRKGGTIRVGTNDAEGLAQFLRDRFPKGITAGGS
jgi:hypothetical protein